jgi:hypothetical protein
MVLNISLVHSSPGDLRISILSPAGTESVLAASRAGPEKGKALVSFCRNIQQRVVRTQMKEMICSEKESHS